MEDIFPLSDKAEVEKQSMQLSWPAKLFGVFFSYVFHPLFIPLYVILFLLYVHPSAFSGFSEAARNQTVLIIILNLLAFPLISVLLLKAVGFIQSIYLRTQKDRIIPYMACGIFFFWTYTVFKQQTHYPLILTSFVLGIFLASSLGLLANIYFKISLHAIGVGGWIGIFLVIFRSNSMLMSWPLMIVLLISGCVCSARLLLSSHKPIDIYSGIIVGILAQLVAAMFII